MKSIKPGRGPSMISGIMCLFIGLFGVVWTIFVGRISGLFALFGVFFILVAIVMALYNLKNATGKNRYSAYDITDSSEESDPFNERYGAYQTDNQTKHQSDTFAQAFCPYCGTAVGKDYQFCYHCGKPLPKNI